MSANYKPLYRSARHQMIAGVCAGLGEYASIDPTLVRVLCMLGFFITGPVIVLVYLVMIFIIPLEPYEPGSA